MSGVSFVSETELDEIRKKRQEEWEKVRKEDDPLGKLKYFVVSCFQQGERGGAIFLFYELLCSLSS